MLGRCVLFGGLLLLTGAGVAAAEQNGGGISCTPSGSLVRLADLPEASGLAVGRNRLWTHNDSGAPVLYAFEPNGKPAGRVTLTGARVEDWEALAIGPCGSGSCLYVGDIGDNNAKRPHVTVYRVPEPAPGAASAKVTDVFQAVYPDGAHDAESLLIAPDGTLLIVTKGDTGPVSLYKFPRELRSGAPMKLERVGQPIAQKAGGNTRITDGAISSDGRWAVLRTNSALTFYPADGFLRGDFGNARRYDLKALGEPQGEGVAFGAGDAVLLAGEGGGKKQPGTLAALSCKR